jgi:hypothetical protein
MCELTYEDIKVGDEASLTRTITEVYIVNYAGLTGDWNPVHADAEHAARSMFGERIAHGMLVAGLISAVLGTQLPSRPAAEHAACDAASRGSPGLLRPASSSRWPPPGPGKRWSARMGAVGGPVVCHLHAHSRGPRQYPRHTAQGRALAGGRTSRGRRPGCVDPVTTTPTTRGSRPAGALIPAEHGGRLHAGPIWPVVKTGPYAGSHLSWLSGRQAPGAGRRRARGKENPHDHRARQRRGRPPVQPEGRPGVRAPAGRPGCRRGRAGLALLATAGVSRRF